MKRFIPFLLFTVLLGASGIALAADGGIENLRQTGKAFASVAKQVSPAVVFVQAEADQPAATANTPFGREQSPFNDDLFRRFFGDAFPGPGNKAIPGQPRREMDTIPSPSRVRASRM